MQKAMHADKDLMSKVAMINQGLSFNKTHQDIISGDYYAAKYDIDYQLKLPPSSEPERRRDAKKRRKYELVYKYL